MEVYCQNIPFCKYDISYGNFYVVVAWKVRQRIIVSEKFNNFEKCSKYIVEYFWNKSQ